MGTAAGSVVVGVMRQDADVSIRRRALDLVLALVNEDNIQALTTELLDYLKVSRLLITPLCWLASCSSTNHVPKIRDEGPCRRTDLQSCAAHFLGHSILCCAFRHLATTQAVNLPPMPMHQVCDVEFKPDLTDKICQLVQRFAPEKRWQIDSLLQV